MVKHLAKTTPARMVFVLLQGVPMDSKPQKRSLLFANPFSAWTELTFKLLGFGKPAAMQEEKEIAVAVIPTRDARSAQRAKPLKAKARIKPKAKSRKRAKR